MRRSRRISSIQVLLAALNAVSVTSSSYRNKKAKLLRDRERADAAKRKALLDKQKLEANRLDLDYKRLRNQKLAQSLKEPQKEKRGGLPVKKCVGCESIWPVATEGACPTCEGRLQPMALS